MTGGFVGAGLLAAGASTRGSRIAVPLVEGAAGATATGGATGVVGVMIGGGAGMPSGFTRPLASTGA